MSVATNGKCPHELSVITQQLSESLMIHEFLLQRTGESLYQIIRLTKVRSGHIPVPRSTTVRVRFGLRAEIFCGRVDAAISVAVFESAFVR